MFTWYTFVLSPPLNPLHQHIFLVQISSPLSSSTLGMSGNTSSHPGTLLTNRTSITPDPLSSPLNILQVVLYVLGVAHPSSMLHVVPNAFVLVFGCFTFCTVVLLSSHNWLLVNSPSFHPFAPKSSPTSRPLIVISPTPPFLMLGLFFLAYFSHSAMLLSPSSSVILFFWPFLVYQIAPHQLLPIHSSHSWHSPPLWACQQLHLLSGSLFLNLSSSF